jgi:hypothetical protein
MNPASVHVGFRWGWDRNLDSKVRHDTGLTRAHYARLLAFSADGQSVADAHAADTTTAPGPTAMRDADAVAPRNVEQNITAQGGELLIVNRDAANLPHCDKTSSTSSRHSRCVQ